MGFFDSIGDALASTAGAVGKGAVTGANQGEQQGYNRQKAQEFLAARQAAYHAAVDPDKLAKLTAQHALDALGKWDLENGEVLAHDPALRAQHDLARQHFYGIISGQTPANELDLMFGAPGHKGGPPLPGADTGPGAPPASDVTPPNVNQTPSLFEQVAQAPASLPPVASTQALGPRLAPGEPPVFGAAPLPFQFHDTVPPVPPVLVGEPKGGIPAPAPAPAGPVQPPAPAPSGSPVHDRLAALLADPHPAVAWEAGMTTKGHQAAQKRSDAANDSEIRALQKQLTAAPRSAILSAQAPYAGSQAQARLGQTKAATGLAQEQTRASQVLTPVRAAVGLSGIEHQRVGEQQGWEKVKISAGQLAVAKQNAATSARNADANTLRAANDAVYKDGLLKRINLAISTAPQTEEGKNKRAMLGYYGRIIGATQSLGPIKGSPANAIAPGAITEAEKILTTMKQGAPAAAPAESGPTGIRFSGNPNPPAATGIHIPGTPGNPRHSTAAPPPATFSGPAPTEGEKAAVQSMGGKFKYYLGRSDPATQTRLLHTYQSVYGKPFGRR